MTQPVLIAEAQPAPERWLARWTRLRKEIRLENGTRRLALDLPAMTLPAGRFICILGPSGCGKTTLLSLLGLVDVEYTGDLRLRLAITESSSGSVEFAPREAYTPHHRRRIGFIFQDVRLRPELSSLQNVCDPLQYLGLGDRGLREEHARECLEHIGIGRADQARRVASFSGGMQQRTAIARALATRPSLICADEPTANLDERLAETIYRDLREISRLHGISVLVVTHERRWAHQFADFVLEIEEAYPTTDEMEAARACGWPYRVHWRDCSDAGTEPASRPGSGVLPPPLPTAGSAVRFADALREAGREYLYLLRWLSNWITLRPLRARLGRSDAPVTPPIPSHLFLPQLIALVTCSLLCGAGFLFYRVQEAVLAYQHDKLNQLQVVRRVRIDSPSSPDGSLIKLDLPDLQRYLEEAEVGVSSIVPRLDLYGWGVTPDDARYLEQEGELPAGLRGEMLDTGPASLDALGTYTDHTREDRLSLALIGIDPGDPAARDLGITADSAPAAGSNDALPGIYVTPSRFDWMTLGNFPHAPQTDEVVSIAFLSNPEVSRIATDPQPGPPTSGGPALQCLRFRVAGYLDPQDTSALRLETPEPPVQGAIHRAAFDRITRWQADPLGDAQLPRPWLCPGGTVTSGGLRYSRPQTGLVPVPGRYDVFARSPRDVPRLHEALERYAHDRSVVYGDLASERRLVQSMIEVMNLVELVGLLLLIIPISIAMVVLWLTVQSVLERRREQLLLFVVMGASRWRLQLQSLLLTILLVLPAVAFGFVLTEYLPSLMTAPGGPLQLEPELIDRLETARIGLGGLVRMSALALAGSAIVSWTAIRTIYRTNPADAFRGNL